MKILNKFIWSKKEPSNKNDIWFDGSTWKIYTEEAWQAFTLPVDAADKVAKMLENASEVYQEKLTAGEGIIIDDNEINLTLKTVNGEPIIGEGNIIIESSTSNAVESEEVASTTPTPEFPYATKGDLTELSAEVSKKQDTITDLETIRSGASKGATAIQEVKTINGQSIVGSGNIEIPGGGGSGGSTTDLTAVAKWGVLTQTLKQVGNNTDGYTVQVSNPIYGWIPQSFIDEVTNFGGIMISNNVSPTEKPIFNPETGYFEYRGIINLAYDEMRSAYMVGRNLFVNSVANYGYAVQYTTNIVRPYEKKLRCLLHTPATNEMGQYRFHNFISYIPTLELGIFNMEFSCIILYSTGINYSFAGCPCLKEVGYFDAAQITSNINGFTANYSLEKLFLKELKANLNLGASSFFKEECVLYMIEKSAATSAITITLHANAYARAMANAEIVAALEAHPNVSLASA